MPVTAYRRLKSLPPIKAADVIDGVSVKDERNSSTDYIASLDFSFQPQAVRNLLSRQGIPFAETQAPDLTVVPIWRSPPIGWKNLCNEQDILKHCARFVREDLNKRRTGIFGDVGKWPEACEKNKGLGMIMKSVGISRHASSLAEARHCAKS